MSAANPAEPLEGQQYHGIVKGPCLGCGETVPENTLACPACGRKRKFSQRQYDFLLRCSQREKAGKSGVKWWNYYRHNPNTAVRLEGADLGLTHLEKANLVLADLRGAWLREVHLEGAVLPVAQLEGADLSWAHLDGADLSPNQARFVGEGGWGAVGRRCGRGARSEAASRRSLDSLFGAPASGRPSFLS